MEISIHKYKPLRGSSYIPLDDYLSNKKCCINIQSEDNKCLMYCASYHLHKDEIIKDAYRGSKYKPYLNDFNWSKISFPVKVNEISFMLEANSTRS